MLIFLLSRLIVDIGQRVEFVHHDVDIVAAYTMTLHRDALTLVGTSDGVELTTADVALLCVEMGGHGVNTRRITNEDHLVGQLLWLQMEMKTRTVCVDDQF